MSTQRCVIDSEAFATFCTCSYNTHFGASIKLWLLDSGTCLQVTRMQASSWRLILLRHVGINHHSNRGSHATAWHIPSKGERVMFSVMFVCPHCGVPIPWCTWPSRKEVPPSSGKETSQEGFLSQDQAKDSLLLSLQSIFLSHLRWGSKWSVCLVGCLVLKKLHVWPCESSFKTSFNSQYLLNYFTFWSFLNPIVLGILHVVLDRSFCSLWGRRSQHWRRVHC